MTHFVIVELQSTYAKQVNYMTHLINQHGVGVKCPDDEINEQSSLTTPAITLSDHRTVYDAKYGRPQWGRGWSNADTCGQGEGGMKMGHFLRTSFMDDP